MGNKEPAQRADFLKHENQGVKAMCELMQKLIDKIIKYSRLSPERIAELAKQIRQS